MGDDLNRFLDGCVERVRDVCLALRELVLEAVPDAGERLQTSRRDVSYRVGGSKQQFCAIAPCRSHVNLYFHQGADLEDPKQLLEGTGENMRHVKIRTVRDINAEALVPLMTAAAALTRHEDPDA